MSAMHICLLPAQFIQPLVKDKLREWAAAYVAATPNAVSFDRELERCAVFLAESFLPGRLVVQVTEDSQN